MSEVLKTRTIGPLGYERDHPSKIRRAFALGCGGVIVDGVVPATVAAEAEKSKSLLLSGLQDYQYKYEGKTKLREWEDTKPLALMDTFRWLGEQADWAIAANLRPRPEGGFGIFMVAWLGNLNRPWHADVVNGAACCDMHLHIYGAGMVLAAPAQPTELPFTSYDSLALASNDPSSMFPETINANDRALQERNFELVALKPGQRLFFRDGCLHRSAYTEGPKLRGLMF